LSVRILQSLNNIRKEMDMHYFVLPRRRDALVLGLGAMLSLGALAHEYRAGDVRIGHPYATPSLAGASSGAAYIATLESTSAKPDRLLRASTPLAGSVELHTMSVGADGVMRMRMLDAIAVVPDQPIKMRPGQGTHLMLVGLKQPLVEGERFPMTLEFERAGKVDVKVVVQIPKPRPGDAAAHHH
jgi:periplasmic copper chaperone A